MKLKITLNSRDEYEGRWFKLFPITQYERPESLLSMVYKHGHFFISDSKNLLDFSSKVLINYYYG